MCVCMHGVDEYLLNESKSTRKVDGASSSRFVERVTQTSISNSYENKGHLFVEMDVKILKGVKCLTQISHTAIYRPRQVIPTQ